MIPKKTRTLRRQDPRSEVTTADVRGILNRTETGEQSSFLLWDISDNGVRLWAPQQFAVGELLRLTIAKPSVAVVTVRVAWCKQLPDYGGYQIGLAAVDGQSRLETLHRVLARDPAVDSASVDSSQAAP